MNKEYLKNTRQEGEALEMLNQLENNSVALAFFDPQYEKAGTVLNSADWPLHFQSEQQIINIIKEIFRVLKKSGFCFLWVNREILRTDRFQHWLSQTPLLKVVDVLVWDKHFFGCGNYFRSKCEFAFLLQKHPINSKKFTSRTFPNLWGEDKPSTSKRKHPHQKPFFLIRSLIEATTQEKDLVIDPCAGSFVVLEACQATNRNFLGVDLTYQELTEFNTERERERVKSLSIAEQITTENMPLNKQNIKENEPKTKEN
jgi:site-specific DNA-methyltransferase (adenine-specific)